MQTRYKHSNLGLFVNCSTKFATATEHVNSEVPGTHQMEVDHRDVLLSLQDT